jgi:hypothetical protein
MFDVHAVGDVCPFCEQPIPRDHFEEIKERIETRERESSAAVAARVRDQLAHETAEALDAARREASAALDREKEEGAARIAAARDEARLGAEAAASTQLAEIERTAQEARALITAQLVEAEAARKIAEQAGATLLEQLAEVRREGEAEVARFKEAATENEAAIREDAERAALATVSEKIRSMDSARQESEAALLIRITDAEAAGASARATGEALQAQLEQARKDADAMIEKVRIEAAARETAVREEAARLTEAALQARITGAEQAKTEAEAKAAAAEEAARVLKETQESQIEARVNEVRTAMEAAQTQAVNAVKSEAYEEKLKWSERVAELQRTLDKKTAEELGEGAEIDLFESLKAKFGSDKIERVGQGRPGADIIHTVIHNGMECGKIIYDSKDHNAWRNDFVTKLATDKIGAKADHAILSVRKFPQGTRQLHVQDGVILANPARVVALVHVVREHIVKSHALRLSNEARAQKSAELYTFITSAQCTDLLSRIDTQAQELLDMQVSEKKVHDNMWKKQGILYSSIQKTGADLSNRIDMILGTAGNGEQAVNE